MIGDRKIDAIDFIEEDLPIILTELASQNIPDIDFEIY
jgi:hypothetical protein